MPNGYSFQGKCYVDNANLKLAVLGSYPTFNPDGSYWYVDQNVSQVSVGSIVSYGIANNMTSATAEIYFNAPVCFIPEINFGNTVNDPTDMFMLFSVIFIVAMMGFRAGFRP